MKTGRQPSVLEQRRENFCRELKVYGFEKVSYLGELNGVLRYHEAGSDYYIEVFYIAAFTLVREQRGEEIEYTRLDGFNEALSYIDTLFN